MRQQRKDRGRWQYSWIAILMLLMWFLLFFLLASDPVETAVREVVQRATLPPETALFALVLILFARACLALIGAYVALHLFGLIGSSTYENNQLVRVRGKRDVYLDVVSLSECIRSTAKRIIGLKFISVEVTVFRHRAMICVTVEVPTAQDIISRSDALRRELNASLAKLNVLLWRRPILHVKLATLAAPMTDGIFSSGIFGRRPGQATNFPKPQPPSSSSLFGRGLSEPKKATPPPRDADSPFDEEYQGGNAFYEAFWDIFQEAEKPDTRPSAPSQRDDAGSESTDGDEPPTLLPPPARP